MTELAKILASSNGIAIIHVNPYLCGLNKRTITRRMGLSDFDYYKWLNETRSFYTCDLLLEVKSSLF